jgi:hypothetical protein
LLLSADQFLDFVCVAAPRAGTTWLFEALREHPAVYVPPAKELNFFNEPFLSHLEFKYARGIAYYRRQFESAPPDAILGELTPTYYVDPGAADRIYRHFPGVKIICLLRHPVEVVFSTYLKALAYLPLAPTFRAALETNPELIELGYYHKYLSRYCERFPKTRIYVRTYEAFFADAVQECAALYRFLGVDDTFRPTVLGRRINTRKEVRWPAAVRFRHGLQTALNHRATLPIKRWLTRSNALAALDKRLAESNLRQAALPTPDDETRRWLLETFEEDIGQLENLFGIELDVWRR